MQSNFNTKYKPQSGLITLFIYFALALSTLLVFRQVRNFDFVNYDDDWYVYDNQHVLSGLTRESISWAFTTGFASNWHPMTWLSLMLDCSLFGPEPGGFHLVNLFLHIANTLLLFAVLKKMTGSFWPSAFVAAAFALHPMHVESVAWIAERKDVLSTFFMFLTLAAYAGYVKQKTVFRYVLSLVLFAFGLMAKPMLVTLPFVLLLLDYWPLERIKFGTSAIAADNKKSFLPWSKLILEKIPFFALSASSSVVTFMVQRASGAMKGIDIFGAKARVFNAAVSYFEYVKNMFWPSNLAVLYPHPADSISNAKATACIIFLIALSALLLYLARRRKYLATGWLWYLGTLVPVIGLVQVGGQSMADRYSYIPFTGLFIIIAWGLPELLSKLPHRKIILSIVMVVALAAMGISSHQQVRFWSDGITLFSRAIDVTQNSYAAYDGLGLACGKLGLYQEAIDAYTQVIKIKPDYVTAYNNLGAAHFSLKRYKEAIQAYKQAIRIKPELAAYYNLGNAYNGLGLYNEAKEAFKQAISIKPKFAAAHFGLGVTCLNTGDKASAMEEYKILKTLDAAMADKLFSIINK